MCCEEGSFISQQILRRRIPEILKFLQSYVSIDPDEKHAAFDSPICSLMPSAAAEIAYLSQRYSGFRLMHRCVRRMTDTKHAPKRMSDIKMFTMIERNYEVLHFEWSSNVPSSTTHQLCHFKSTASSDGKLQCCDCNCKVGGNDDNDYSSKYNHKNMVYALYLIL